MWSLEPVSEEFLENRKMFLREGKPATCARFRFKVEKV